MIQCFVCVCSISDSLCVCGLEVCIIGFTIQFYFHKVVIYCNVLVSAYDLVEEKSYWKHMLTIELACVLQ